MTDAEQRSGAKDDPHKAPESGDKMPPKVPSEPTKKS